MKQGKQFSSRCSFPMTCHWMSGSQESTVIPVPPLAQAFGSTVSAQNSCTRTPQTWIVRERVRSVRGRVVSSQTKFFLSIGFSLSARWFLLSSPLLHFLFHSFYQVKRVMGEGADEWDSDGPKWPAPARWKG